MKHSGILTYFNQRFPPLGVGFLAVIVAAWTAGLIVGPAWFDNATVLAAIAIAFTAFLLRQRIVDEFKDKRHDDTNYPDRPFQRGIVSARTLVIIGSMALIMEWTAVWIAGGWLSIGWYLPVFMYSLLMMREFFLVDWLERHFTLYFALHEVVFIVYGVWLVRVINVPLDASSIAWILSFTAAMMAIEIGRKYSVRLNPNGTPVKDTYVSVWGRESTVAFIGLLLMTAGIGMTYAESSVFLLLLPSLAIPFMYRFKQRDAIVKLSIITVVVGLAAAGAWL